MLSTLLACVCLFQLHSCKAVGLPVITNDVDFLLQKYNFIETPSRGYFNVFYETPGNTSSLPQNFDNGDVRKYGAARLHLMDYDHPTVDLHKSKATLVINFLRGNPLVFYVINPITGELRKTVLGLDRGDEPIVVIEAEFWFAISLKTIRPGNFALISSIAIPGTHRSDSVIASRDQLMLDYPQHADVILYFTRP